MKKILIKVFVLIILFSICFYSFEICNANIVNKFSGTTGDANADKAITNSIGAVLKVVRISGASVAVCILLVIGIKYMLASAGDRADIKKYAVNYIVGAVILFGASSILGIIQKFIEKGLE